MRKLLSANFHRLSKSKLFWLGLACMIGLAAWAAGNRAYEVRTYPQYAYDTADGLWFVGAMYLPVVLSVFVSLWLGAQYDYGTIRNKLMVGHTRTEIYLANLITCTAVTILYHLAYIIVVWGMGSALLAPFATQSKDLLLMTAISICTAVSMSSIFTLLAMLIPNRAAGAVAAMLLALGMIISAATIDSILKAPEFIENAFSMHIDGQLVPEDPFPNPRYPTELERTVYTHIMCLIPVGQVFHLLDLVYQPAMALLPLYALALTLATTGIGLWLFRRTDIK